MTILETRDDAIQTLHKPLAAAILGLFIHALTL